MVGHSMGGILAHTLVAEIGDNLWNVFSNDPFDRMDIDTSQKETIRRLLFFDPDPAVNRAIFVGTPHRGASMAEGGLAGMISRTASMPAEILAATTSLIDPAAAIKLGIKVDLDRKVTAVQSLEPGAPMVKALEISPYRKGVIYHSIIGDRGKGDTSSSSDGVVAYWSSHQEGAASELIVPTGHDAYKSPLAIEEINRILLDHAVCVH